jgi:membrane protease YdiL (CAAX protease family)
MTEAQAGPPPAGIAAPRLGAVALSIGLAAILAVRVLLLGLWADGLAVGAAFGLALVALWVMAAGPDLARGRLVATVRAPGFGLRAAITMTVGAAFGLALVTLALLGASVRGIWVPHGLGQPDVSFVGWASITILVATAEEGILRGVLFDRIRAARGVVAAIALTTIAFALIHVPVYGWHVVPLDLAVGLGFAGLRLSTRSVLAPAAAHVVADLATWWL